MSPEITVGEYCFVLRDEVAWLVASDCVRERGEPGDEIRADLLRDLAGHSWPKNVDVDHRFDNAMLRLVASEIDQIAFKWIPNQTVRMAIGEISPGVVGIVGVGASRSLKTIVCTRDVGPTLSAHFATRFAQVTKMMGNNTRFDTRAHDVQTDLDTLSELTRK